MAQELLFASLFIILSFMMLGKIVSKSISFLFRIFESLGVFSIFTLAFWMSHLTGAIEPNHNL
jgi:hypothetical protein